MSAADARLRQPWSLRGLVTQLSSGTTTPAEVMSRARDRIAATESQLHAWVGEGHDVDAMPGGPLAGVPCGVKDIIDVAGWPTRCGSGLRAHTQPASRDAAVVSGWRRAGAVPIGKTVTTEFAFFAPGPTRNPSAPGHTPGGSSSGSAAAVAAGQVPLALGSQTAGSVIRPAAYCGVAALVLSRGRLPADGVTGLSPSLDSHGFFAARASDLALAFSALTGEPDVGATQARTPRLLLWNASAFGVVEPAIQAALRNARDRLVAAGAAVDEFPAEESITELAAAHPVVMAYEAARERAAELARADQLSDPLANLLRSGSATADADYTEALRTVRAGKIGVTRALANTYDAILGPAAPGPAPRGLEVTGDPLLSRPWQVLGVPQLAIPAAPARDGLPLGLQLIGREGAETALLGTGCWVESHLGS